jgi:hypothetical protein
LQAREAGGKATRRQQHDPPVLEYWSYVVWIHHNISLVYSGIAASVTSGV